MDKKIIKLCQLLDDRGEFYSKLGSIGHPELDAHHQGCADTIRFIKSAIKEIYK